MLKECSYHAQRSRFCTFFRLLCIRFCTRLCRESLRQADGSHLSDACQRCGQFRDGQRKELHAFYNWKVNRGKNGKANVVTDFDLGPELRYEITCYFEGNKMVDASGRNKTGERNLSKLNRNGAKRWQQSEYLTPA